MGDSVDYVVIFETETGWYWRALSNNHRIVAIGGEPFASYANAVRGASDVINREMPIFQDGSTELARYLSKIATKGNENE